MRVRPLFRRSERTWLAFDERVAPEADKVDTLILVARCFEVDERAVKERK